MRKRKNLHTNFIKFILEKYSEQGQSLPDDDEVDRPEGEAQPSKLKKKISVRKMNEFDEEEIQDEEDIHEFEDDEIIDELLNEYRKLKKKYENNRFRYRRK